MTHKGLAAPHVCHRAFLVCTGVSRMARNVVLARRMILDPASIVSNEATTSLFRRWRLGIDAVSLNHFSLSITSFSFVEEKKESA
jgi:ABC-type antimicrobial peptide transport system ATPase subunit